MANNPAKLQVFILLLLCTITTFVVNKCNALSMRLIHRHSPDSPIYQPNLTDSERITELVRMSRARIQTLANHIKSRSNSSASNDDIVFRPSMTKQDWLYIVRMGIGTFDETPSFRTFHLALDTGSDLSWTQCESCNPCFHQTYPYFAASKSKSYNVLGCSHCPDTAECQPNNWCKFARTYGDGSSMTAVAASETFYFETDYDQYVGLSNVVFGCGISMTNFNAYESQPENEVSGLMGMSYGSMSFVRQTLQYSKGRFSYCLQRLPAPIGTVPSPMFLRFGDDILERPDMKVTPMPMQAHPLYYLNLEGITVGKKRLAIDPEVFKLRADMSRGCAIDSGAGVSFLVTEAYQVFAYQMARYIERRNKNVRRVENPGTIFQLCYERYTEPEKVLLPWVTFHFENNADFVIKQSGVFWIGVTESGTGMICSTILESKENLNFITLLGAKQQMDHRIVYDTENQLLMFGPDDCSRAN